MSHVLVVDDDPSLGELIQTVLEARGYQVSLHERGADALDEVLARPVDLVVTDLQLPDISGTELCEQIAQNRPNVPVVVITAFGTLDTAIAAMRAGAHDFIPKPVDVRHLALTVERALQTRALREEVRRLRESVDAGALVDELVGTSPPMRRMQELIARVAPTDSSVLISGESGTGKELVARAIHHHSPRRDGPFVAVNLAALPHALIESELFGHVKGAFTDARTSRPGLFVQAHGGTLFLDEVGELPLELQPKLLRALQERVVRPLGASAEVPVDVRVVAASNRDLAAAVDEGRFRQDLYYRLDVIGMDMPPLRARGHDVLLIAQHFIGVYARRLGKRVDGLLSATAQKLLDYDWPGNVRELQNCIERAVTLTDLDRLAVEDLPPHIRDHRPLRASGADSAPVELLSMDEVEQRHMRRVLDAVGGNKSMAAKILGVDRTTLYRKLALLKTGSER